MLKKMFKKSNPIFILIILAVLAVIWSVSTSVKDNIRTKNSYQHEFAILNKSFNRDINRSMNLYKSFEKHFQGANHVPFFIVIPSRDLGLFRDRFENAKNNNEIEKTPILMTEEEVLHKAGEPDIAYDGAYAMQVIKLCFGLLNIAKYYMLIDSDAYFTKDFDPKILFYNKKLKTIATLFTQKEKESMKFSKHYLVPASCIGHITKCNINSVCIEDGNHFLNMTIIKDFWGNNKKDEMYRFVYGVVHINSDAIHRMKNIMMNKGYSSFAKLIRIVPFEIQWYGEYVLQHEDFIPTAELFTEINDYDECHNESGGEGKYGIIFQSMIYNLSNDKDIENRSDNQLKYRRPITCDNRELPNG